MSLEAKVPPPAVAITAAIIIFAIARFTPHVAMPAGLRWIVALVLLVTGIAISVSGAMAFRRARTTLNPTRPEQASSLVNEGIFQLTRNPMYLGLLVVLVGWSVFLSSAWALLGVAGFVLYMNLFQIAPEERALTRLFGNEYGAYKARVRRWL